MVERILTSVFGIVLIFLVNFYGGIYLKLFGIILTIVGLYEYFMLFKNIKRSFMLIVILINVFVFLINTDIFIKFTFYFLLLFIFACINSFFDKIDSKEIVYTIFSFTYITMPVYMLISLRSFENGKGLIWLPYLICWATDTFAYFVGITFGKRRIWKNISPKKSLEGLFGGLVGGVVATLIYMMIFDSHHINLKMNYNFITLGIILSFVAQIGDLFASILKRENNKKDFGFILPGHGGVLDRFDSMLLVAPLIFILAYLKII